MTKTTDFDFNFPSELIAHEPAVERDKSRLMVLNRQAQTVEHKHFYDIIDYLNSGDLLVLNDTKVMPANLVGKKVEGGGKVEVLLVNPGEQKIQDQSTKFKTNPKIKDQCQKWKCLVRPGKRLKVGSKVRFGEGQLIGTVLEKLEGGEQIIKFESEGKFWEVVHELGEVPLPPYIKSLKFKDQSAKQAQNYKDQRSKRYQTVYAEKEGASAAPTAGLHFTPELLEKIKAKGVRVAYVTLHTGLGTFLPVRTEKIEDHPMHEEYFEIPDETVKAVEKAKRVIAVGTTAVRTLETVFNSSPNPLLLEREGGGKVGRSKLFIYPGYKFKVVDALITNFHWPKSTLIMLVSALAGKDFIMKAYQEAIQEKYRFFSFGDAMFIL
ncbi:tRNA preQ1(34) S-adenosylmethionine ribosyltransferase-isomerase QueA [candidate division WOR-1 bacterium RIFOXYB2_FULL_42_35]|uniref:S-adenosylmethionine:tRNA ribosyltransferase-isomerase n=1 Tax=candidate division WOR-1 bacterium RIFOXYC2_FULL_41_25 TaxID=1802586 RepID=A0A1F4TQF5_UNCSA|nr:MAG: tRNA preQ1(34) S-adenosylmethionine ribosyltransferase-isomerase QueA [candidate division WOR-1 bacterium RIFOXYA2_FULL_41_14]OGC25532.1 MAG: tRNA preQ1(34) S-adenosylmethionine ribosyltransferase-isomerase QueA [candidate division WOR-1 bacterium RIFOXYB2_FULL_42_35]OGC34964.1 MAG: tRNA preQ1(34) S-adenosylmethionine ribosyltransferase-isomerase QueA [candidate division WOR-1 bacterium RIFOXYC2_FULL_41_25]OGC41523.1 MAG: tRNA preQ1(34) S-adenosylmethionine ribosyltransferase-isomerase Q